MRAKYEGITSTRAFCAIPFHDIAPLLYLPVSTDANEDEVSSFTPKKLAIVPFIPPAFSP